MAEQQPGPVLVERDEEHRVRVDRREIPRVIGRLGQMECAAPAAT
jgi:hypothetical protein